MVSTVIPKYIIILCIQLGKIQTERNKTCTLKIYIFPRSFVSMENSTHVQRDACRRKIDGKIVAFLSSVVYYFQDLLKSGNRALLQNKTFISL